MHKRAAIQVWGALSLSMAVAGAWVAHSGCAGSKAVSGAPQGAAAESVALGPNRAYAGAPPTIPHTLSDDFSAECLDCHEQGGDVGVGKPAPRVGHPEEGFCRQCHILPLVDGPTVAAGFGGLKPAGRVNRANKTAPPVIPHRVEPLHVVCVACHAGEGATATVTDHPDREDCRQCHVSAWGEP